MTLLQTITDRQGIRECYDMLMGALEKKGKSVGRKSFELRGARRMADVYERQLPTQSMRLAFAGIKDKSVYNILVGISNLKERPAVPAVNMDFQLTVPASGINRSYSCAFAKDSAGSVYFVHRGLFFGGKFTMRRDVFFEHYEGLVAYVDDGSEHSKVAVIGDLTNRKFVEWFAFFLQEVQRISAIPKPPRRHKPDRKTRAINRAIVKDAIVELNRTLGKVKELDGNGFGLYQPRKGESATACLEFQFEDRTLVLEPTLERDRIAVVIYPRAKVRGRDALAAFIDKGFGREIDIISKGEVGYEYDGSSVYYEVPLKANRGGAKVLFVEYTNMTINAVVKTLAKA